MSDLALSTSNSVSSTGAVSQNNVEDKLIDDKTSEIQEKLTSQDNLENLSTKKTSGKVGRILTGIAGGLLLAAGLAAAAVATVASFGLAVPGAIAAVAAAVGVTGASITAGVTGAAGIGCLVGSIVSGRKAEAFVEGQNKNQNTNDNLAVLTNGKITNIKTEDDKNNKARKEALQKEKTEYNKNTLYSGLTRSFIPGQVGQAANHVIIDGKFLIGPLLGGYFDKTGVDDIFAAIDINDPKKPKLVDQDDMYALKTDYIANFVKKTIEMTNGLSKEFSKENIALIRYNLCLCFTNGKYIGEAGNKLHAFTDENFVNEISTFVQNEMTNLKDSENKEDQEKYTYLSIFKAALKLSDDDITKLAELEKDKTEQIKVDDE